jgi:hypothetical protein
LSSYGLRNTVERGFNRLKQWRGVATRYDKYALTYLGGVLLACAVIHARAWAPPNWETRPRKPALYLREGEHFTAVVPRAQERAERINEFFWRVPE